MKLQCLFIRAGKPTDSPKGFTIHQSTLVEPSKGKPYYAILFTDERDHSERSPAIGFHVENEE